MTLIVALKSAEGAVLASDSCNTIGSWSGTLAKKDNQLKIYKLNEFCAIAIHGDTEVAADYVSTLLDKESTADYVEEITERFMLFARQRYSYVSAFDKRPQLGFIFCGLDSHDNPRIYSLQSDNKFGNRPLFNSGTCLAGTIEYA